MKRLYSRSLPLWMITALVVASLLLLSGCSQSDKEKAMDLADQYEDLIDKYGEELKSKKDEGDMAGMMETLQKFQQESMDIAQQMEGFEGVLSPEEKKEVEARFEEVVGKLSQIMTQ